MNCANHPAVAEQVFRCSRCGVPYCVDCLVDIQGRRYCARCKGEHIADVRSGVDSRNIELAGIGRRFAAVWVDGFIIGVPMMIVMFAIVFPAAIAGKSTASPSISWLSWLMMPVYIVYEALMLKARGQTLGKMALGIKVVQQGGQSISGGQAWGRAVVRGLFVSFLSLVNYLPAFFTKEKTCVHDMAAHTRVVIIRS